MTSLDGFLVIDKPKNWTSFDVVAKLRSKTGIRKIGHAGTLDPFATGVLVLAFNRATTLIEYFQQQEKVYRGRIRLGQVSDSDDLEGHKTTIPVSTPPSDESVRLTLARFTGKIMQLPPVYSALKVQGRRMYELARKGQTFERKPRPVTIHALKLLSYAYPYLDLEARVSAGTYIRALARDIGEDLGTGGLLEELVRQRVGQLTLREAHDLNDISIARLPHLLYPPEIAVEHLMQLIPSSGELARLAAGQTIKAPGAVLARLPETQEVAIVNRAGNLQMIVTYEREANALRRTRLIDTSLAR
ncbi:MAG: tRNA pseudouridine(55) synthase TruB [Parcubacteria group bacterium]